MSHSTSERLKQNAERIMNSWEERVLKDIPAAIHQNTLALRDSLPEYLEQLADALSITINRTTARKLADRINSERVGREHGHERAGSLNYSMQQLIFEYHILRQVICDIMEEDAPLTPVEREIIVASVEQAVNDAATQFSETLRDTQEKLTHAMAHDLRSPITAAKASAQLILRRPDNADCCIQAASRISSSMDRLDSMIHDLLDASRIRAGQRLSLKFEECDLDLIARQVASEIGVTCNNRIAVVSDGQCIGYWDQGSLRRMLDNLATNAVKYGATDTPIIITIKQNEESATLAVHNQGKAIPADEQADLFQRFRRSRSTLTKSGWGLGLTVVEGLTNAHHGTIQVDSQEGIGTTFTLVLPKNIRRQAQANQALG